LVEYLRRDHVWASIKYTNNGTPRDYISANLDFFAEFKLSSASQLILVSNFHQNQFRKTEKTNEDWTHDNSDAERS
jgi:hypothetical protein